MTSTACSASNVHLALVHHPVVDKNGQTIAAALTPLDLHDIARAGRTYGVGGFYVVTPLEDQQVLVSRIIDHWVAGVGAAYNPDRRDALTMIHVAPSLDAVTTRIANETGMAPVTVVTSARIDQGTLNYAQLRRKAAEPRPLLLLFGTAWGLAPEVMDRADYRLAPIQGGTGYNHLSVRSAVSIILDRICAIDGR